MTPFELDILLHYYTSPRPHRVELDEPPIWRETRDWFLKEGLLMQEKHAHGGSYSATDRAKCLIDHICQLPLPEWQMPIAAAPKEKP